MVVVFMDQLLWFFNQFYNSLRVDALMIHFYGKNGTWLHILLMVTVMPIVEKESRSNQAKRYLLVWLKQMLQPIPGRSLLLDSRMGWLVLTLLLLMTKWLMRHTLLSRAWLSMVALLTQPMMESTSTTTLWSWEMALLLAQSGHLKSDMMNATNMWPLVIMATASLIMTQLFDQIENSIYFYIISLL